MTLYPLFFTFKELVYGDGFVAECAIRGRALAAQEEEREWWFNGVEPGGLAERGETLNDAYYSFRDTLKEILFDISYATETFDAFEANRLGLVHEVVADEAALTEACARIKRRLGAGAPGAIAAAKDLIAHVNGRPIDDALLDETARRIAEARAGDEGKEGVAAFLGKRKPKWTG